VANLKNSHCFNSIAIGVVVSIIKKPTEYTPNPTRVVKGVPEAELVLPNVCDREHSNPHRSEKKQKPTVTRSKSETVGQAFVLPPIFTIRNSKK